MARLEWACGAIALLAAACGSTTLQNGTVPEGGEDDGSDDATASPDGSTPNDAGVPETGRGDENPVATACTAPPFVTFTATFATLAGGTGTAPSTAGVKVGFSTCAGFDVFSNAAGVASTELTQSTPVSPFYSASDAIDTIGAELQTAEDVAVAPLLLSTSQVQDVPTMADGGTGPTILVAISPGSAAPCNTVTGVKLAVTGHPEAKVFYMDPTWPAKVAPTAGTSATGPYAFIGGIVLDGGSSVAVTGTSATKVDGGTCSVVLDGAGQTGNFQLVPSSITYGVATVSN